MKFSVITINYNNLEGLKRTYESVVAQTCQDFEWIIIDGGSTDGSREFIAEHQEKTSYWCSERDRGVYHAMNKGIERAKGEYLVFMNSGDAFYDENVLKKVKDLQSESDIISGLAYFEDDGKLIRWYHPNILVQLYEDTVNHQGSFIRRHLFEKLKYDENLKIVSDWKFFLETIVLGDASFEYSDIAVAKQERNGISLCEQFKELGDREREQVIKEKFSPLMLKEIALLESYENCGAAQRARQLYYQGGIGRFITRAVMAVLYRLFYKENKSEQLCQN